MYSLPLLRFANFTYFYEGALLCTYEQYNSDKTLVKALKLLEPVIILLV